MSKNKKIFDKAAKEEKRKKIAETFPGIDFAEALKNGPCQHYDCYNTHVRSGAEWDENLYDSEMTRLATSHSQTLESGDRFCNNIIKIQRYPLKFSNSPLYVDIVKQIKLFIAARFRLNFPNRTSKLYKSTSKEFKAHISNTVDKYSSYVLIDKVKNKDFYLGMKKSGTDPD